MNRVHRECAFQEPASRKTEGVGFEPTWTFARRFSRPVHLAALPPLPRQAPDPSGCAEPIRSVAPKRATGLEPATFSLGS